MSREVGVTYSAPMAGAIWRDEKWHTRRFSGIAHVPEDAEFVGVAEIGSAAMLPRRSAAACNGDYLFNLYTGSSLPTPYRAKPRLRVGDVMVVREPWQTLRSWDTHSPAMLVHLLQRNGLAAPIWWADGGESNTTSSEGAGRKRQAMHMPFAFARSRRVVTAVRVERLGDISEADANAEGFFRHDGNGRRTDSPLFPSADREFSVYWTRLHGPGAWYRDRRKWVLVYEFARRSA